MTQLQREKQFTAMFPDTVQDSSTLGAAAVAAGVLGLKQTARLLTNPKLRQTTKVRLSVWDCSGPMPVKNMLSDCKGQKQTSHFVFLTGEACLYGTD